MITIGTIPARIKGFSRPLRLHFSGPARRHFSGLVVAMTVAHCSTVGRLARLL